MKLMRTCDVSIIMLLLQMYAALNGIIAADVIIGRRTDFCTQEVDIRQIHDKFPDHVGGLKNLYSIGPQQAFFVVKFWVNERFTN